MKAKTLLQQEGFSIFFNENESLYPPVKRRVFICTKNHIFIKNSGCIPPSPHYTLSKPGNRLQSLHPSLH